MSFYHTFLLSYTYGIGNNGTDDIYSFEFSLATINN